MLSVARGHRTSRDPLFENLLDDACFKEMMARLQTKLDEIRKEIETME